MLLLFALGVNNMFDENKIFNVLYLDDDISISLPDIYLAEKYRIHFVIAHDCEKARKLLLKAKFDAFILDIEIKDSRETGIEFAEELRTSSTYYATPIIFISMHTHYSSRLLSHIKNSSFLSKPTSEEKLIEQFSLMLNIPEYITKFYSFQPLIITIANETKLEISPNKLSFIEAYGKEITFQYIDGKTIHLLCKYGTFKNILNQIKEKDINCLRQIHRSVIINIKQIRKLHLENHIGDVYLFADDIPKPLGIKYRCNVAEFITEGK